MTEANLPVVSLTCNSCNKIRPVTVLTACKEVYEPTNDDGIDWGVQLYTWMLARCPACSSMNVLVYDSEDGVTQVVYPKKAKQKFQRLPSSVAKAYKAAQAVRDIEPNAFAVLLRRLLETVCIDRNAIGKTLYEQLKDLASKGEMPEQLANMANLLRDMGNIGAHAGIGDITAAELPYLDSLCEAVLEYVYNAPLLIKDVEDRVKAIKNPKSTTTN